LLLQLDLPAAPQSRGSVTLRDADPALGAAHPLNLLGDERDWAVLKKGLAISRRIFSAGPIADYVVEETVPAPTSPATRRWMR
jgi:choline dehydrogenase